MVYLLWSRHNAVLGKESIYLYYKSLISEQALETYCITSGDVLTVLQTEALLGTYAFGGTEAALTYPSHK